MRTATAGREAAGLRRTLRPRTPDRDGLIDLASNDHLGLSGDDRLIRAAVRATEDWGTGSTGSRLVTGTTLLHAELEARLAAFTGAPGALVVTDAVFSVDGDLAPLSALPAAAVRHGALLMVDEAHSLGVVGESGRGAVHAAGLAGKSHIVRTVTLSKSLGSQGGAVLGAPEVIETLIETGRSFIFDTGLAPACVGAALCALEILDERPELQKRASAIARTLAATARELGLESGGPAAAVVPIVLGPPGAAVSAATLCAELGVRVGCFRPPSVPHGRSCLRLTARANLGSDDLAVIRRALTAVAERKVG